MLFVWHTPVNTISATPARARMMWQPPRIYPLDDDLLAVLLWWQSE